ncbi:MAG: saccharopine dehydrogenase, partial [Bacteroidetes bacterium]|nr:saccharopine dehydrogenase [Bacteroidota bacterium]
GFIGFQTLEKILKMAKEVVDISFFNEDPFELDQLAKENGVTAIVDCGVAPGLDNIILGYHSKRMEVKRFECLVGGLPKERKWPYEYKAPFSPTDVIAEYTRPARIMRDGAVITLPALSEPEIINFKEVGDLEAFNTDGLRSLLTTMEIPNMSEKTLRYPGHIELMKIYRETGYFSEDEIEVNGNMIRPIDLTTSLLLPQWKLEPSEEEFTIMRVTVEGTEDGEDKVYEYKLYEEGDKKTGWSSMSRSTGFTCTAAVRLILKEGYSNPGINPPEFLGYEESHFNFIMDELKKRNVDIEGRQLAG